MKLIPKYLTAWGKMPLVLNDKGREDWAAEHATELPEVVVSAPRPLTETERRWKGDLTDDEYRAQRDALHASLLNAIKGSTIMGQTLMGGENSALPYGFGIVDIATGVGALEDMARGITRSAIPAARAAKYQQRVALLAMLEMRAPLLNNHSLVWDPALSKENIINTWREAAVKGDKEAGSKALLEWWKLKTGEYPQDYYHGTKYLFNLFEPRYTWEPYFHFGDLNTAKGSLYAGHPGFNIKHVYLNKGRTLKVPDAVNWDVEHISLSWLRDQGFGNLLDWPYDIEISPSQYKDLVHRYGHYDTFDTAAATKEARKFADEIGFDSLEYPNYGEGNGSASIAVVRPTLIKSAEPFTFDDKGNLIDITKRFDFSNPDIRYYTEGEMLPSEDGVLMKVNPYKGTDLQLFDEAADAIYESLNYPNTPHFNKQALLVFAESELPELKRELEEINQVSGLLLQRYDEGLHFKGLNESNAIWDPEGNLTVESNIKINPDFAGNNLVSTIARHEVGGHGFNGNMTGLEDANIIGKLNLLKLLGLSDKQIQLAVISYLTKGKGLTLKEALQLSWGYVMAVKYPKVYKMMRYNAGKLKELLLLLSGVDTSSSQFLYKSDPNELTTRARTGHILAASEGIKEPVYTDDIKGLEDMYTPESLKAYLKVALSLLPYLGLGTISNLLTKPNNYAKQ